jgi:hypothetical protein
MALIPRGGGEAYCHEFKCENEAGRRYMVYVDALTGEEERIVLVRETEGGVALL